MFYICDLNIPNRGPVVFNNININVFMYSLVAALPHHIHYKDNFNIRPFNSDWAGCCIKTWAQSQSVPKEHDFHPPAALQRGALRSRPVSVLKQALLRPLLALNRHCSSVQAWLQDWQTWAQRRD